MGRRNFREMIEAKWAERKFVCVGLDSEVAKMNREFMSRHSNPQCAFNRAIIDATKDLVCAYKPNAAFYEAEGDNGLNALFDTVRYIQKTAPDVPVILDAKRADIDNTNACYAAAAFDQLRADAITVHPYLGAEALKPFLDRKDKGVIVLCRTSNKGAGEFQDRLINPTREEADAWNLWRDAGIDRSGPDYKAYDPMPLYQFLAHRVAKVWNRHGNCALVVAATYPEELKRVRGIVGDLPILIPGIGAQGGDLEKTIVDGADSRNRGMIINSSRGIIFASNGTDFAEAARRETQKLHDCIVAVRAQGWR